MNAHTGKPKNLSDMININIRKGFLMKAPEKKDNLHAYITTMTGEAYVENGLKETSK